MFIICNVQYVTVQPVLWLHFLPFKLFVNLQYTFGLPTNFFQALVEQARGMLETIDGVTTVHGRFYELCSNYHKVSVCCKFTLSHIIDLFF